MADFAQLDLKAASEEGSWLHLEHDGEPMFLDDDAERPEKPQRIHIKGMADPKVMAACRAVTRTQTLMQDRLARSSEKDAEGVVKKFEAKLEDAMSDMIVAACDDWENITWAGEALEFNRENLLKICGSGTLFFKQVTDAIQEHKRLFTNAASA
tara:strand:- start:1204 stop:1665 length:462 start_codon:yes stop_codon:yes gene_type:complete